MKSLLTETQKDFLYSKTLEELFIKESGVMSFINELFETESQNTPLHEAIFLVTIFEFVNCLMYIYSPSQVLNTYNKKSNQDNLLHYLTHNVTPNYDFNSSLLSMKDLDILNEVLIKYLVSPFKQALRVTLEVGDHTYVFETNIRIKPKILSYSIKYKIKDHIEFLYKIGEIYWEFIELMPKDNIII